MFLEEAIMVDYNCEQTPLVR